MLLGDICQLTPETRLLDLCCGKAEMLCQWSRQWGIRGVGVDISPVFLAAAANRASELDVADRLTLVEADAGLYTPEAQAFDVVSCIGATWIGSGLIGTINLMKKALKPDGLLLVGEPYWITPPPAKLYADLYVSEDDFATLVGTLDRIEAAGCELVEMVLADQDSWDRYVASQWMTMDTWLSSHPDDPEADQFRTAMAQSKRTYLESQRAYFGWGVFVLRTDA